MSEISHQPEVPYADYPTLFGGDIPPGFEAVHSSNRRFAERVIPRTEDNYTDVDNLAIDACEAALTATDHRLGRNSSELGTMCTQDKDGLWLTLPTFYHNGDGTRLAMIGTKSYMDYINKLEGEHSPYADRRTYLKTMITAAFDDVVFGPHGREGDELASAAIASEYLRTLGLPEDVIEDVVVGIQASIFDELAGTQRYNPAHGAEPVQRGSLIGDLWALGTPQGPANTFTLMVENLWKPGTGSGQVLRRVALDEFIESTALSIDNAWYGKRLSDFFALAQKYPEARQAFADGLIGNETFLFEKHNYERTGDPRVDDLMRAGKTQSALLQKRLGYAVKENRMTIEQAFHCALSYADARAWQHGERQTAMLGELSPADISKLLLTERTEDELRNPVDAEMFFVAYMTEIVR